MNLIEYALWAEARRILIFGPKMPPGAIPWRAFDAARAVDRAARAAVYGGVKTDGRQ